MFDTAHWRSVISILLQMVSEINIETIRFNRHYVPINFYKSNNETLPSCLKFNAHFNAKYDLRANRSGKCTREQSDVNLRTLHCAMLSTRILISIINCFRSRFSNLLPDKTFIHHHHLYSLSIIFAQIRTCSHASRNDKMFIDERMASLFFNRVQLSLCTPNDH